MEIFEINLSTACVSFDLSIGFKFDSFNQSTKLFCSEISIESDILFSTRAEVISFLLKKTLSF